MILLFHNFLHFAKLLNKKYGTHIESRILHLHKIFYSAYFNEILYPVISQYKISWVLFWRNSWEPYMRNAYFVPYEGHPAAPAFKAFTSRPDILMNEDINKIKF